MEVNSKEKNYELLEKGLFGNRIRTWHRIEDIVKSGYAGKITIRCKAKKEQLGKYLEYNIGLAELAEKQREWTRKGIEQHQFIFNETPPDHLLLIQGELSLIDGIYHLSYSLEKNKPLREAIKKPQYVKGPGAKLLLRSFLNRSSYDDLLCIAEMFSGHVIEFSTYDTFVGNIPGRNTVIWEVRKY
jgi:hypothetical protein